jgi:hypothetical protein
MNLIKANLKKLEVGFLVKFIPLIALVFFIVGKLGFSYLVDLFFIKNLNHDFISAGKSEKKISNFSKLIKSVESKEKVFKKLEEEIIPVMKVDSYLFENVFKFEDCFKKVKKTFKKVKKPLKTKPKLVVSLKLTLEATALMDGRRLAFINGFTFFEGSKKDIEAKGLKLVLKVLKIGYNKVQISLINKESGQEVKKTWLVRGENSVSFQL